MSENTPKMLVSEELLPAKCLVETLQSAIDLYGEDVRVSKGWVVGIVETAFRKRCASHLCGKTTATLIAEACDEIKAMLLEKNESYGDSALKPTRIFSRATTVQGLCTRIDDKLSRIMRGNTAIFAENDVDDLIGYLVLLRIAKKQESETPVRRVPHQVRAARGYEGQGGLNCGPADHARAGTSEVASEDQPLLRHVPEVPDRT